MYSYSPRSSRCIGLVALFLAISQIPSSIMGEETVPDLKHVGDKILEYRKWMFQQQGGIEFASVLSAVDDPKDDFAYPRSLAVKTAILWPRLFVSVEGDGRDESEPTKRVSVYDFVQHRTRAYGHGEGFITPDRHMFSSGNCYLFKYLHLAEGFQAYRHGQDNSALPSVPECLQNAEYKVQGFEKLGEINCLLVQGGERDKIWFAPEKSYLIHRRERRHDDKSLREVTQIQKYKEACDGWHLPEQILVQQYYGHYGPNDQLERRGELHFSLQLNVDLVRCGKVDEKQLEVEFPEGIRITDLVTNPN